MNEYVSIVISLLIRVIIAGAILVAGWHYLNGFSLVLFPFVILAAAVLVGRPIAQLLGTPAGFLFYPNKQYDRPQPVYGIPEARRKEGHFEEAMDGFRLITRQHPQELKAWIRMMEVAAVDLVDKARVDVIYQEGLEVLKEEEDRRQLTQMYQAFTSMI